MQIENSASKTRPDARKLRMILQDRHFLLYVDNYVDIYMSSSADGYFSQQDTMHELYFKI